MIDVAFIMAFIGAAVGLIIGILIYSEISEDIGGSFSATVLVQNGTAGGITTLDTGVACTVHSSTIYSVNILTVLSSVTPDFSPITGVDSCKGIAHDPITGNWYGLFGNAAGGFSNTPDLAQFDPTTGVGTMFPSTFSKTNNMAITSSGDIYVTHGRDSTTNKRIALLDKTTGQEVSGCDTLNYSSIAWNWDTDTMWVIQPIANPFMVIQEINPTTCALLGSPIVTTAPSNGQGSPHAFTYNTNDGLFYMTVQSLPYSIDPITGVAIAVGGGLGGTTRGWAFETVTEVESPPIYEGGTPETFTRADSIAMTVLAIIPITLFFGLFTLFNSRGVEI